MAPALVSTQCPEALVFKVLLQDVSTRRQHISILGSGWAASRALKESGFPGWERRVDRPRRNSRGLVLLAVPGTFPSPDGCQALTDCCAEDAVVPRWGDSSVRGGCRGESHRRESCAPGDFCKLFQSRARTDPWMQRVHLDREIMVRSTWDQTLQVSRERHVLPSSLIWPRVQPRGPQAAQAAQAPGT